MMKSLLFIVGFLFWQIQVDAQCKKIYSFDTDQFGGPSTTIEFNGPSDKIQRTHDLRKQYFYRDSNVFHEWSRVEVTSYVEQLYQR